MVTHQSPQDNSATALVKFALSECSWYYYYYYCSFIRRSFAWQ